MGVAEVDKNSNDTMAKGVGVAANGGSNRKASGGLDEITTSTKILDENYKKKYRNRSTSSQNSFSSDSYSENRTKIMRRTKILYGNSKKKYRLAQPQVRITSTKTHTLEADQMAM